MPDPKLDDIPVMCLGNTARQATRLVMRVYGLHMRSVDLNFPQFGLLVALAQLSGSNVREIADNLGLDASTLVRNIALLERRGAVTSDGGRGRAGKMYRLTKSGQELLQSALAAWREAQVSLVAELGEEDVDAMRQSLRRMGDAAKRIAERMDL